MHMQVNKHRVREYMHVYAVCVSCVRVSLTLIHARACTCGHLFDRACCVPEVGAGERAISGYTHTHTHKHTHTNTEMHMHVTQMHMHVHAHDDVQSMAVIVCVYIHVCSCIYICIYIYTYIYRSRWW